MLSNDAWKKCINFQKYQLDKEILRNGGFLHLLLKKGKNPRVSYFPVS